MAFEHRISHRSVRDRAEAEAIFRIDSDGMRRGLRTPARWWPRNGPSCSLPRRSDSGRIAAGAL